MKLNSTQVEQTLSKLNAEVLADDHPAHNSPKCLGTTHSFSTAAASKFWSLVKCLKWNSDPARL